jgi:hypothetical protein
MQEQASYVRLLWQYYVSIVNSQWVLNITGMPNLIIGDNCVNISRNMDLLTNNFISFLAGISTKINQGIVHLMDVTAFQTAVNSFRQPMINMSNCLLEYEQLLDDTNTWLKGVSSSSSDSTGNFDLSSAASVYSSTNDRHYLLLSDYQNYRAGLSLQPLVNRVSLFYDSPLSLDAVDTAVFSVLTSIVDSLETSLKDTYHSMYDNFDNINDHLNDSDKIVENFLRSRAIWRYPFVNLETPQVG